MSVLFCCFFLLVVEVVVLNFESNGVNDEGRSLDFFLNCLLMILLLSVLVFVFGE